MRQRTLIFFVFLLSFTLFSFSVSAQDAEQLYQSALYEEEVTGNLEKAIALYNKVLEGSKDESLAAKAQLQIGFCYEKLGKTEAIKAYELVLEKYAGQKEQAATARARLAELKTDAPAGPSIVNLDFDIPGYSMEPIELSPDGTKMLGVEMLKGQNIVVRHLGTNKIDFITNYEWLKEYHWTYHPIWSPDGKEILYFASLVDKSKRKIANSLRISDLKAQTRVLFECGTDLAAPNAWLPDGSAVVVIKGRPDNSQPQELGLVPSQGGEFKKLVTLQGFAQNVGRSRTTACVSPDGRFIAFTDIPPGEKSDIFVTSTDGKTSWPLLEHPAEQKYPRWSPDGKHVVFISMRHGNWALWGVPVKEGKAVGDPFIVREGMADALLGNWTHNGLASWNWLRMNDIFLMEVDPTTGEPTTEPKQIEYIPTGSNLYPTWSPDGNSLAFLRIDNNSGTLFVVVIQNDGEKVQEYKVPTGYGSGYLRWMPDGKGIGMNSYNEKKQKFLLSRKFDSEKWETTLIPVVAEQGWTKFEWSGSGKAFMYAKAGVGIVEHDLETGEERTVYTPKSKGPMNFRWLKCSKDYKWLAFTEFNTKIVAVNLETGESHVVGKKIGFPSWSPDGQKILARRGWSPKGPKQSLFIIPSSGGDVKEIDLSQSLSKDSEIDTSDWSPDGKQVVFVLKQNQSDALLYKNIIPKDKK
jgi:Tol biopolymer transport system component